MLPDMDDFRKSMADIQELMSVGLEPWTEECSARARLLRVLREQLEDKQFTREEAMQIICAHGLWMFTDHGKD